MTRYAVMVNDELYGEICHSWLGARSYLDDAQRAAAPGANVRIVSMTITDCPKCDDGSDEEDE